MSPSSEFPYCVSQSWAMTSLWEAWSTACPELSQRVVIAQLFGSPCRLPSSGSTHSCWFWPFLRSDQEVHKYQRSSMERSQALPFGGLARMCGSTMHGRACPGHGSSSSQFVPLCSQRAIKLNHLHLACAPDAQGCFRIYSLLEYAPPSRLLLWEHTSYCNQESHLC